MCYNNAMSNTSNITYEPIDFVAYFKLIKWPLLLFLVVEIFLRLWLAKNIEIGILLENQEAVFWSLRSVFFIFMAWRVLAVFGWSSAITAVAGLLVGFALGLAMAVFRVFVGFDVWKVFNLLTESVISALVASFVMVLAGFILSRFNIGVK